MRGLAAGKVDAMRAWLRDNWGLSAAALFLLALAVPLLGRYGLWFDEIFSVVMSRHLDDIVQMVRTQENNMLLHYLLLWCWQMLGDGSEVFLRSSSVLVVVLSLFPLHAASKRLAGSTVANTACLLFVSHFLVLEHVRTCRGYSLALLMAALVFLLWVRALQTPTVSRWLMVGAVAGLAVWSHYFAVLVPAVLLVAMFWRDGFRQPWHQIFFAAGAFVTVALPVALTMPPDGAAQIGWADVPDLRVIAGTLWMLGGADGLLEQPVLSAMLCLVLLSLLWRCATWGAGSAWRSLGIGLAVGLVVVVGAVLIESFLWQPLFVYRFFTPLAPVYCFVLAVGLAQLWPWLRILLVTLTLAISAWATWQPFLFEPVPVRYWWKPMVQKLAIDMRQGDVLLVYPSFLRMPVDYYLEIFDPDKSLPRPSEYVTGYYRQGGGVEPEPDWQFLQTLSGNPQRIWLVADEKNIASWERLRRTRAPAIRAFLSGSRHLVYEKRYGTMTVQCYEARLGQSQDLPPANQ